ncbi:MAG TPA: peptidase M28, partial [Cyclobacteriaceae bacterium]|nr:peptidase M28 [Cyclobacteriaceae bacterium]
MNKIVSILMKFSLCFFVLLASVMSHAQDFKSVAPNLDKVQPDSIRAHIKYLADDKLRGRLPGTPGFQLAMDYVIDQYKRMGLEPAGENKGFLQTVKLRRARVDRDNTLATLINGETTKDLVFGDGFVLSPNFEETKIELTAPLVFVGYGVSEPELGYDDYAG